MVGEDDNKKVDCVEQQLGRRVGTVERSGSANKGSLIVYRRVRRMSRPNTRSKRNDDRIHLTIGNSRSEQT